MNYLEVQSVTKQYTGQLALNNVSIEVPEQSIFGLLGPNGAGKTTLIRIINQITQPDTGQVLMEGRPIVRDDVALIGYLPEERGLYKKMKVGEQALYLARLKGMSRQDALRQLKYWFEKFEIQPWWDKKVEELSKGMQQKVQFVTTVLHRPKLLIFDEPFSGFDPINANLLKNEILDLKRQGSTIIFSTHNMASVEELCDHISLINRAKVILSGEVSSIRHHYKQNLINLEFGNGANNLSELLPSGCRVIEQTQEKRSQTAIVQSDNGLSVNGLLQVLLPSIEIHGVQEVLPSMNDIFIELVKSSDANKQQFQS